MLTLNALLDDLGVPPDLTLVARHTPRERSLRRVMPWIVAERPDLFTVFQALQTAKFETAMTKAIFLASFLDNGPKSAIFAGIYRLDGHKRVSFEEYWALPQNQELKALGMVGMEEAAREPLLFDMAPTGTLSEWIGKLCITWPGLERSWWRWADRNVFPIEAILPESAFAPAMPEWDSLVVSWSELSVLPTEWRRRLAEWRGVYHIFDVSRERGYVGSAYGEENILVD